VPVWVHGTGHTHQPRAEKPRLYLVHQGYRVGLILAHLQVELFPDLAYPVHHVASVLFSGARQSARPAMAREAAREAEEGQGEWKAGARKGFRGGGKGGCVDVVKEWRCGEALHVMVCVCVCQLLFCISCMCFSKTDIYGGEARSTLPCDVGV